MLLMKPSEQGFQFHKYSFAKCKARHMGMGPLALMSLNHTGAVAGLLRGGSCCICLIFCTSPPDMAHVPFPEVRHWAGL